MATSNVTNDTIVVGTNKLPTIVGRVKSFLSRISFGNKDIDPHKLRREAQKAQSQILYHHRFT